MTFTEGTELVLSELRKWSEYRIAVSSYNRAGEGPLATVQARTMEDLAGPVGQLHFRDIMLDSVRAIWSPPVGRNPSAHQPFILSPAFPNANLPVFPFADRNQRQTDRLCGFVSNEPTAWRSRRSEGRRRIGRIVPEEGKRTETEAFHSHRFANKKIGNQKKTENKFKKNIYESSCSKIVDNSLQYPAAVLVPKPSDPCNKSFLLSPENSQEVQIRTVNTELVLDQLDENITYFISVRAETAAGLGGCEWHNARAARRSGVNKRT